VIGSVKAFPLEDDAHRGVDFSQRFLSAFWAAGEGLIAKFLLVFKLYTAIFAPVRINRHSYLSFKKTNPL
jgi:hypothetical protein